MNNTTANIDRHTVLPYLPELLVEERAGEYLVLNPLGPRWFAGTKLHAEVCMAGDGQKSIAKICSELAPTHPGLTDERVVAIAESLQQAKIFNASTKPRIRRLHVVFFNITRRCNLRCPYCYYDSAPDTLPADETIQQELAAADWIELSQQIAQINPNAKIMVSGGEPLIRSDAVEIIAGVARNRLPVKLITNGTLLSPQLIERLAEVEGFSVQVSIDSIDPQVNALSRGKKSLDRALAAVRGLKAAGIDFEISATVSNLNYKNIKELKSFCQRKGYSFRYSIFMLSGPRSKQNAHWLALSPEDYLDISLYALEGYNPDTTLGHPVVPGLRRYTCGLGSGQIDIAPDGSLYPCSHICEPEYYMGNIKTDDLNQMISAGYDRFKSCEVDQLSPCATTKCPVRYFCAGGCRANALHNFGILAAAAKNCKQLRQIYSTALWVSVNGASLLNNGGSKANVFFKRS